MALVVSLAFLSLSGTEMSLTLQESFKARAMANLCAEQGLQQIRDNNNYTGTQNLNFADQGSCHFTISNLGGDHRRIESEGRKANVMRRVQIEVDDLDPIMTLSLWQEVADF